jgi:putative SOS response-associated peptidase YedK
MINARAETAATKPAFRASYKKRRCLVLADGFYEWQVDPHTGGKQPWHIRLRSGLPFGIAGLWDHWEKSGKPCVESCAILTCEPNKLMAEIHDRMPVMIPADLYGAWLDCKTTAEGNIADLLRPYDPDKMVAYPVSTLVNNPRHDSEKCVEPVLSMPGEA